MWKNIAQNMIFFLRKSHWRWIAKDVWNLNSRSEHAVNAISCFSIYLCILVAVLLFTVYSILSDNLCSNCNIVISQKTFWHKFSPCCKPFLIWKFSPMRGPSKYLIYNVVADEFHVKNVWIHRFVFFFSLFRLHFHIT